MTTETLVYYRPGDNADIMAVILEGQHDVTSAEEQVGIAALCAEDFWQNSDGYEARWPLTFILYLPPDKTEVARLEVGYFMEPVFSARRPRAVNGKAS